MAALGSSTSEVGIDRADNVHGVIYEEERLGISNAVRYFA
jgi:hypothetical protein